MLNLLSLQTKRSLCDGVGEVSPGRCSVQAEDFGLFGDGDDDGLLITCEDYKLELFGHINSTQRRPFQIF